ncbi:MAG TPA: methylated-DNA--[protein]-cysteine S-methyltransferase [Treponemataceae bacterium]|nr:methylated-DNA--[protein]-cysteine S-methyltransferase [Treponemataceae bacterium]
MSHVVSEKQHIAFYNTKIGMFQIHCTHTHVTYIRCISEPINGQNSNPNNLCQIVIRQIREYLDTKRSEFDLPLFFDGTDFQKKVWHAVSTIPYGKTLSYKAIAQKIGNPHAARAVGMANNKNKLQIVVPCHRVIGSNGSFVGYASGLLVKQKLLDIEKAKNRLFMMVGAVGRSLYE